MREWKVRVVLVGAGPGRPDLITVLGREWIKRADVILYDRLVDPRLLDEARPGCRAILVGKEFGKYVLDQDAITRLMLDEVKKGCLVVRLKGGDPCFFGRGGEEAEALAREGIPFEIVPGITAGIGVAAYVGIPLTHRLLSSSITFSTGHRANHRTDELPGETRVFYMAGKNIPAIAEELISSGFSPDCPAIAVEAGTWPRQRSVWTTVGHLDRDAKLNSPVLVIVGEVVRCRNYMNWFEQRPLFGKRILVPRSSEHRGKLAAMLDEAGAEPIEFSPVAFEPLGDLLSTLNDLRSFPAVHFGDPRSAEIFMRLLRDARRLAGIYISAAGHFTASTLERFGIVPDHVGPPSKEPVLCLGPTIVLGGLKAVHVPLYREVLREDERERLQQFAFNGAAFPSSTSVERTVRLMGSNFLGQHPLFSMGPETSAEMKRQGLEVAAEAMPPTFEGLVDVVVQHYTERKVSCQASSIL